MPGVAPATRNTVFWGVTCGALASLAAVHVHLRRRGRVWKHGSLLLREGTRAAIAFWGAYLLYPDDAVTLYDLPPQVRVLLLLPLTYFLIAVGARWSRPPVTGRPSRRRWRQVCAFQLLLSAGLVGSLDVESTTRAILLAGAIVVSMVIYRIGVPRPREG